MTGRLLTIATVLTLSASLAYAGQRQRAPERNGSSGQSSGGQAAPAPAPAPAPAQRAEPRSAPPPPARQDNGGGSQIQRWGSPRSEAAPPPAPRAQAPTPPPSRQEASGGSQIQRWGVPRGERPEASGSTNRSEPATNRSEPAPMTGLFRSARERQPSAGSSPESAPLIQSGSPAASAGTAAGGVVRQAVPDGGQRVAQPRQRYPNPDDQRQASGVAVARPSGSQPQRPGRDGTTVIYGSRPGTRVYYNNYYYYPRASYPYGYGSYGLGYFYYDPYAWYDNYYYDPYYPTYSYPSYYGGGIYQSRYNYPTGEIRLQVRPRHAEVYVDGYYAGRVDDFDGFLQGLRIEEGPHTIEIVAPGYETLTFNVRIIPGRKIDYRGDLRPYRP